MVRDCTLRRKTAVGTVHINRPIPEPAAAEGAVVLADGEAWLVVRVGHEVMDEDELARVELSCQA